MKLTPEGSHHLTYCTNIHPGHGWSEVLANLRTYAPALKHNHQEMSNGDLFRLAS